MLNADILAQIFEACDLESCLAFAETCRTNYALFETLEAPVRDKVQQRVPWFNKDDFEDISWLKCARIVVARSKTSLDPRNKHLYLIKDMRVPAALCRNDTEIRENVDLQKDNKTRRKMKALFEEQTQSFAGDFEVIEGTKLILPGISMDLTTLMSAPSDYQDIEELDYSGYPNTAVSPSGLRVRNENGFVRIIAENDNLLHVRFRYAAQEKADILIYKHKPLHQDPDGTIVIGYRSFPIYHAPKTDGDDMLSDIEGNVVSLLPGSAGALVVTHARDQVHRQMIAYVEPTWGLPHVLICTVPPNYTYSGGYSDFGTEFFTFYKGYFFLYFCGRFFKLWIDLGYRSALRDDTLSIDHLLSQKVKNRCLTVWNRNFPAIGYLDDDLWMNPKGHQIVRGRAGMERYVTVGAACGRVLGDLETGKTYFSKNCSSQRITIPYTLGDGKFEFGGFGTHVANSMLDSMIWLREDDAEGEEDPLVEDHSDIFRIYCEQAADKKEEHEIRMDHEKLQDSDRDFSDDERDLEEEYPWRETLEDFRERVIRLNITEEGAELRQLQREANTDEIEEDDDEDDWEDEDEEEEEEYDSEYDSELDTEDDFSDTEAYDDADDYDEDPTMYDDIFRDMPITLNPSTMNAPQAFKRVEDLVKKKKTTFFTIFNGEAVVREV